VLSENDDEVATQRYHMARLLNAADDLAIIINDYSGMPSTRNTTLTMKGDAADVDATLEQFASILSAANDFKKTLPSTWQWHAGVIGVIVDFKTEVGVDG
jgi:hypothetical protein